VTCTRDLLDTCVVLCLSPGLRWRHGVSHRRAGQRDLVEVADVPDADHGSRYLHPHPPPHPPLLPPVSFTCPSHHRRLLRVPVHVPVRVRRSPRPPGRRPLTSPRWPDCPALLPHPPGGRSDVPVEARTGVSSTTTKGPPTVAREGSTNELSEGQRLPDPTVQSDAVSISTLSTQNLSSSSTVRSQPTGSRAGTDAASIALSGAYATAEAYAKGSDPPVIPPPSNEVIDSFAGLARVTAGRPGTTRGPREADNNDRQEAGAGSSPTRPGQPRGPVTATPGNEMMAQFRAETQTNVDVGGPSPENADVKPPPVVSPVANHTEERRRFPLTVTTTSTSTAASPETRVTSAATAKQTSPQTVTLPGDRKIY